MILFNFHNLCLGQSFWSLAPASKKLS